MSQLYGEKWDPALDPEGQMKGASSGGKFVKLARFGLFVKAVFIVPISSAIVESLFSRCATCPNHSSRLIIEVLMRSAQVRLHPRQDAREHGGRHRGQRPADVGAGGRHRRRSPPLQPGLHAAGPGRGPRADLGLSGEHQLPSSCLLQNLCHQLSLIVVAT
jgi:hypothetical protein